MATYEFLELIPRREGAEIRLNRPGAYNALSLALLHELIAVQQEIRDKAKTGDVRYVLLTGAGKGFCAGHDLKELRGNPDRAFYEKTFASCTEVMLGFQALPVPVIAVVQGIATAAGCQLVASVDLAVALPAARFATPGVHIGLFCSTPMVALTRAVGRKQAMEMLAIGEPIDAQTAQQWGLINAVSDDPASITEGWITKLLAKSPRVLATGKEAFYHQIEQTVADAYAYTAAVMTQNLLGPDAQEGIDAFLAKRPAVFKQ